MKTKSIMNCTIERLRIGYSKHIRSWHGNPCLVPSLEPLIDPRLFIFLFIFFVVVVILLYFIFLTLHSNGGNKLNNKPIMAKPLRKDFYIITKVNLLKTPNFQEFHDEIPNHGFSFLLQRILFYTIPVQILKDVLLLFLGISSSASWCAFKQHYIDWWFLPNAFFQPSVRRRNHYQSTLHSCLTKWLNHLSWIRAAFLRGLSMVKLLQIKRKCYIDKGEGVSVSV